MNRTARILLALPALLTIASAQTNVLKVDVSATRSKDTVGSMTDAAAKSFAKRYQALVGSARLRRDSNARRTRTQAMLPPVRVEISPKSVSKVSRAVNGDINLVFDSTGTRAFPATYQTFLQTVFVNAKSTMNLVFGPPAQGGDVHVSNYDADIGDRDAVAGGYYLPDNGNGQREIRFPVYNSSEAAAVNFVHTLLLAYQGTTPYTYDAFEEGLVRAAAMKIVRTSAAMPNLDQSLIENVLLSTYEVGPYYDWYNQRALGGARFIAPNLRDVPLPAGNSIGGLYLLRYMMSGSAWEKVLTEYPTFIAQFNAGFYANPTLKDDPSGLVALGQQVLGVLRPTDPTIEGRSFSDWYRHQYILETKDSRGQKLLVAPQPITSNLFSGDFGVFDVQTSYFRTDAGGNESLLRGTSYPIFWDPNFNRLFPDSQSERMDIVAGYGSVAPNFPDQNAGIPYRVAIDVPVQDQLIRTYVPAGAIATAAKPTPNDFFGTVEGVTSSTGTSLSVRVSVGGQAVVSTPVTDGAFGALIGTNDWLAARSVVVELLQTASGTTQTILARRINKAPGSLAVDLRVNGENSVTISGGLPKGITMVGFPVDPFSSYAPNVTGVSSTQLLVARWNSSTGKYDLFPDAESFKLGMGYFVRVPADQGLQVPGYVVPPNIPYSVALRPGWNMVACPLLSNVSTTNVLVVRTTGFPTTYAEAQGVDIGTDFYSFVPGPADAASGAPETGSFAPATVFQPGKAYFVRCLAAEGATLVFFPPAATAFGLTTTASVATPAWRLSVTGTGLGRTSTAYVAMSKTATRGFDPKEDSALPPSIGGFQVSAVDGGSYYRDVHPVAASDTFTVRLDGLVAGKTYSVNLVEDLKRARSVSVSRDGGRATVFSGIGRLSFVATSASSTLTIKVVP